MALVLGCATLWFAVVATNVRSRGAGWRDALPTWAYAQVIRFGLDDASHTSASRRLRDDPSPSAAAAIRDAALAACEAGRTSGNRTWDVCLRAASIEVPTGATGERFLLEAMRHVTVGAVARSEGETIIAVALTDQFSDDARSILLRVDDVLLDGCSVPFEVVSRHRPRQAEEERARGVHRVWYPITGIDRLFKLELAIDEAPFDPSHELRIVGEAAFASRLLGAVLDDEAVAAQRDPAAWGVRVATVPFDLAAIAPPAATPLAAPPPVPAPWLSRWWMDARGPSLPPALAAVPILAMIIGGLVLGGFMALGAAAARRLSGGAPRLALPSCPRCRSTLRGDEQALPVACPECGRPIHGRDDCVWTSRRPGWVVFSLLLVVVVAAGALLAGAAARNAATLLSDHFVTPEGEATWLVRATIAGRVDALGPEPRHRLWNGDLQSVRRAQALFAPGPCAAAAEEIFTWLAESKGAMPPSIDDRDGSERRRSLLGFLERAVARDVVPAQRVRPVVEAFGPAVLSRAPLAPAWSVRVGEEIRLPEPVRRVTDVVISPDVTPREWAWPEDFALPAPTEPGWIDVSFVCAWPAAHRSPVVRSGRGPDREMIPAAEGKPLFEQVVHGRVLVRPADAPASLEGDALDEALGRERFVVRVCESGARSALELAETSYQGVWQGRWEILTADAPDLQPCATLRRSSRLDTPAVLGTLPSPLPDSLILRFVPERAPALRTQPGQGDFAWGETKTFRLRRKDTTLVAGARVTIYETEALP